MATHTAEPGRKTPYSKDLRWRIIYKRIGMKKKLIDIAANLNVSVSTVQRIVKLFLRTRDISPSKRSSRFNCFLS